MMRRRLPCLMVLALVLAGCSGSGHAPAEGDGMQASFEDLGLSAGEGRGVVRGVVVDLSLRPVAGADVALATSSGPQATQSDADGRFGFSDVEPGLATVQASKAGYSSVQTTVEVVAGDTDPKAVTIALQRLPGTDPYVTALVWHGFLQCSWTLGGAFATGCLLGDGGAVVVFSSDSSRQFDPVDGAPDFLQSELLWQSTQVLGTNLCMRHYASEGLGGEVIMDDVCGPTPLVQQAERGRLNETKVGAGQGLERVVWVEGYGAHQGPGVALNQQIDVFTHLFYNVVPDPAWRFADDGPYPLPPP